MGKTSVFTLALLTAFLLVMAGAALGEKIKIEKLDDLPRHSYKLELKVLELFEDDAALAVLAKAVQADLEADLAKYEISDKSTLKEFYSNLGTIAMLDGRYDDWTKYYQLRLELEDKEAVRLTTGMTVRAHIAAVGADDKMAAFRETYAKLVNALPYATVEADLKASKGRSEILSQNLIAGIVESRIQPTLDQSDGEMSKDIATSIIGFNSAVRFYLPYKDIIADVLGAYLEANKVEKENIWIEREVELTAEQGGNPVVICVWDSGSDPGVYADQMWTNEEEIAGNGIDDDQNGYVDDVHGIAYTLHSDKATDLLYPIGDIEAERPRKQRLMKGLSDMTANIDSEESAELKKMMAALQKEEVRPFIEDISEYGNYAHGTHVAGIAVRSNPYARLLSSRLTFGHEMIPEEPTVEQAEKDVVAGAETIEYYKKNGVRVVNMSWGGSLAGVESALEANNAGGSPEERKALVRKIFDIGRNGLYEAIKNAPDILFITSAGNSDADVNFEEFIPSSFDLPNIMSVGAVDQAGDETSFTCFGKVDCYANGFDVESFVPGGDPMTMSGTSQASPQVTNLAAKLLALKPGLTPSQVRDLIVDGTDDQMAGDRPVKLINPKKSMELLAKTM